MPLQPQRAQQPEQAAYPPHQMAPNPQQQDAINYSLNKISK